MAKGNRHFNHSKYVSTGTEALGWVLTLISGNPMVSLMTSVGNVLGMMLTPDMDDPNTTYPEYIFGWATRQVAWYCGIRKSRSLKLANDIGKKFMTALTAPYGVIISHRSWLSHVPPIGVITKCLYLYIVYYCICRTVGIDYISIKVLANDALIWYTLFIWTLHDFVHLADDGGMVLFNGKKKYLFGKPFYLHIKERNDEDN